MPCHATPNGSQPDNVGGRLLDRHRRGSGRGRGQQVAADAADAGRLGLACREDARRRVAQGRSTLGERRDDGGCRGGDGRVDDGDGGGCGLALGVGGGDERIAHHCDGCGRYFEGLERQERRAKGLSDASGRVQDDGAEAVLRALLLGLDTEGNGKEAGRGDDGELHDPVGVVKQVTLGIRAQDRNE